MAERQTPTTPINELIINDDGPQLRYLTAKDLMNDMTHWRSREISLGQRTTAHNNQLIAQNNQSTAHNNQPTVYYNATFVRYVTPYDLMFCQNPIPFSDPQLDPFEYLGSGYMLAIVCNTLEGVKALEEYNSEGDIRYNADFHGLGSTIGRNINGRFTVIALIPFLGGFVENDPQKKLALSKPRMPNGECPEGFIDYAVNMIHLDHNHVSFFTAGGHGLRETLFYTLFARAQVYRTRRDMRRAMPCIHEGPVSLDGGLIKKNGMFALGVRKDLDLKFPVISGKYEVSASLVEAEEMLRRLQWESTKLDADVKREQQLLVDEANRKTFP